MTDPLLALEPNIRLAIFLGLLVAMALWEIASPRRRAEIPRLLRWSNNLALVAVDSLVIRLLFPVTAVAFASYTAIHGWGLFNVLALPVWIALPAAVILFDFIIYLQHVLFHAVPVLWRLHRVHHADQEFDVTTGVRFHPIEILLSMALKFAAIAALGPPALAILVFEILLNATALFNHSNVRLPEKLDQLLRLVIVTPDMHRVHHSVLNEETNSNYGFNLPWWDRLLGTYRPQPRDGHDHMIIGLSHFRTHRDQWIDRLLVQPFRGLL